MCGLVGVLRRKSDSDDRARMAAEADRALTAILHRGPDGMGEYNNGAIALRHARLAIIDLSQRARQPMVLQCPVSSRRIVLAFNGEIYNYESLMEELRSFGHVFHSRSDTEVILHSFEQWGNACFEKLRGMFALAIWQQEDQTLTLVRDRFGIKPLYYAKTGSGIAFSSEAHALFAFSGIRQTMDMDSAQVFLQHGWIPAPKTIWQNVISLEPGVVATFAPDRTTTHAYANIADAFMKPVDERIGLAEAVASTRRYLIDSVSRHLVADVPVGVFLSGGIDSSSLVALMRLSGQKSITSVSAVFPGTPYDESEKAATVAREFGTDHRPLAITGLDFSTHLDHIIASLDQPSVDGVNTYFVSLAAKQAGLKVVLSGLGGDELFYGYPSFFTVPQLAQLARMRALPGLGSALSSWSNRYPLNTRAAKLSSLMEVDPVRDRMAHAYCCYRSMFSSAQIRRILPAIHSAQAGNEAHCAFSSSMISGSQKQISFLEFSFYLRSQLLRDCDVMSMAHSVELRVPFVDHILLERVLMVPERFKTRHGTKKMLLTSSLADELPARIVGQKKQGFVLPIDVWLRGEARAILERELTSSEIFDYSVVREMLDRFFRGSLHWSRIWSLFVLNRFARSI